MAAVFKARDAGNTVRTETIIRVRDVGNVSRRLAFWKARDAGGTLRTVFTDAGASFSASASPGTVYGSTLGTGTATTNDTTVTPTGGTAPYTYAWAVVTYDNPSAAPTATAATAATSGFTQTSIGIGESYSATFRCTVTDDDGNTATADVNCFWTDTT